MVIDANQASANSIKKHFPECVIIMCFFHLKSNIRNQKNPIIGRLPKEEYQLVMTEITQLHKSKSKEEFDILKDCILNRWKEKSNLRNFHDYFVKQWLNSDFSNWQIFLTPPGFANTNNPFEDLT